MIYFGIPHTAYYTLYEIIQSIQKETFPILLDGVPYTFMGFS